MTYSVAAVDDHQVALLGVKSLLDSVEECELVATFASVDELLGTADRPDIDVVLLDLRLADGSDPYFNASALKDAGYEVLIYSSLESPYLLRRALKAGVNGVVAKSAPPEELGTAVVTAAQGQAYATAEWAGVIDSDDEFAEVHLSERQREVLELYAMGESARRVAQLTGLSAETVQDYLARIRTKYAVAGRPAPAKIDLFRRAQEDGYVPGPWEG